MDTVPSPKLWYAALKPPMYSVAIMPIWLGSTIAMRQTGQLHGWIFGLFMLSAVLILAWENFSNDVFDAATGVDVNKFNSLVNITGRPGLIFWLAQGCLILGLLGIGAICYLQQDPTVGLIVLTCCLIGYVYQGPPFRLSYLGLGEPLCFLAFGPLACSAAYYSQTQSWSLINLAASVPLGLATTLILFCSHFNQVHDDTAVGKLSPVVRLGTERSARLLPWWCGSIYGLNTLFVGAGLFPLGTLVTLGVIPAAINLCRFISSQHDQPEKLTFCRLMAVRVHFWSSLLLGVGFALSP